MVEPKVGMRCRCVITGHPSLRKGEEFIITEVFSGRDVKFDNKDFRVIYEDHYEIIENVQLEFEF